MSRVFYRYIKCVPFFILKLQLYFVNNNATSQALCGRSEYRIDYKYFLNSWRRPWINKIFSGILCDPESKNEQLWLCNMESVRARLFLG